MLIIALLQSDWAGWNSYLVGHEIVASVLLTRSGDVIHPQLRPLGLGPRLSIVVVVSPLITLTKDQVRAMSQRNVTAVYACERDAYHLTSKTENFSSSLC